MLLQYLIKKNENTSKITEYKPDSDAVKMNCEELKDSDTYLLTFTVVSNDEKAARLLAPLNDSIIAEYKTDCTVLENQAAAYFNKTLFPLINNFERLLRKVLYTAKSSLLNKDKVDSKMKEKIEKNIVDLEAIEFGPLFDCLFTDENFNKTIKTVVGKAPPCTKKQFIELIENQSENPLWTNFPGAKDLCPSLTESFNDLRLLRNDVMHAHNIDAKTFYKAKRLFSEVNVELSELEKTYIPSMNKLVSQDDEWTDSMSATLFEMSKRIQENSINFKLQDPAFMSYINTLNMGQAYPIYNANNVSMMDFLTRGSAVSPFGLRNFENNFNPNVMPEISSNPSDNLIIERKKNPENKKTGEEKDE